MSEVRSSLKHFTDIVRAEQKGPNFVQLFSDRLKCVKRDLSTLSAEGENLKGKFIRGWMTEGNFSLLCIVGALEHAQIAANENKFNWELIKR